MPLARPLRTRRAGRVQHVQTARVGLPQGAQRREDRRGTADGTVARRVRGVRAWFVCGGHRQHPVTSFEFRLSFIVSQAVYTYTQIALSAASRADGSRAPATAPHTRDARHGVCAQRLCPIYRSRRRSTGIASSSPRAPHDSRSGRAHLHTHGHATDRRPLDYSSAQQLRHSQHAALPPTHAITCTAARDEQVGGSRGENDRTCEIYAAVACAAGDLRRARPRCAPSHARVGAASGAVIISRRVHLATA